MIASDGTGNATEKTTVGGNMINILTEGYDINAPWLFDALKAYVRPSHRVAVVALAFRDSVI